MFDWFYCRYEPIWKIIDKRWSNQLHRPLHAAAHYLNPRIHYGPKFNPNDKEIKDRFFEAVDRLVTDGNEKLAIFMQIDAFNNVKDTFSRDDARALLHKKHPADWWNTYGDNVCELQKFAMKVLCLTCSSSVCERNWSAFEMLRLFILLLINYSMQIEYSFYYLFVGSHQEKKPIASKKMNDLVYVMYNSKFKDKKFWNVEIEVVEVNSDDEWITDRSPNLNEEDDIVEVHGDVEGEDVELGDITFDGDDDDDDDSIDPNNDSQEHADQDEERDEEMVQDQDDDSDDNGVMMDLIQMSTLKT